MLLDKLNKDWNRALESGRVSRIDKDILVEDIRQLYDLMYELEIGPVVSPDENSKLHVDQITAPSIPEPLNEAVAEQPPAEPFPELKVDSAETLSKNDEERHEPEKVQDPSEIELEIVTESEPVITPQRDIVDEVKEDAAERTADNKKPDIPPTVEKHSAAEKFPASKTLADVYRANGDNSFAAKMQKNKISDLKAAIDINERFLFINEIFKGETGTYKKAIETLNGMNHYHEALEYIGQIRQENDVKNEEAVSVLIEILKRKFQ